jgi:hypothetical protein
MKNTKIDNKYRGDGSLRVDDLEPAAWQFTRPRKLHKKEQQAVNAIEAGADPLTTCVRLGFTPATLWALLGRTTDTLQYKKLSDEYRSRDI